MKIIFKGTPPPEKEWRGSCYYCKSIIDALQSELTGPIISDEREGDASIIKCPVCNSDMVMYPKK